MAVSSTGLGSEGDREQQVGMRNFPKLLVWLRGLGSCTCDVTPVFSGSGLEVLLTIDSNFKCPLGSLVFGEEVLTTFELKSF